MEKITARKGDVLHKKGDVVNRLEVILSGAAALTDGNDIDIRINGGGIIGAVYEADDVYDFDVLVKEDCSLAVFDYHSDDDIANAVLGIPAIASAVASANMDFAKELLFMLSKSSETLESICRDTKYNYNDYKFLCAKLQKSPETFTYIESLIQPEPSALLAGWQSSVVNAFASQKNTLRANFYVLDPALCVSTVMQAALVGRELRKELSVAVSSIAETRKNTSEFVRAFYDVKSRVDTGEREGAVEAPPISNAMDVILSFSGVKDEIADEFRKDVKKFADTPDRNAKSAEMRALRMNIAKNFYDIYEAAFFKSMEASHIPAEIRMFFLFGFVDENLAGQGNTAALYKIAVAWENDPNGKILPMYEWLTKIYHGNAEPSKNEFDNDWNEFLREELRTGAITEPKAELLKNDRHAMVSFEIHNMFTVANKITNGQMASFVPIFCATDVVRPLDKCIVSPARVQAVIDKILDIDFSCFYRPTLVSYPELKIQHFSYNVEARPYIILLPNFGARGQLWQEIEGVKKTTPAHMVISIFHSEDLESTIVRMCAQFRWEMCRRIQGVRYSDITEPSLTAEYTNYLQFYKKNSMLSSDMKDRVKSALQKARNDYKGVFVSDYEMYIINESAGLPRLNKVARDIVFRYCTLSKKFRRLLGSNPQFQPLLEKWSLTQGAKAHGVDLFKMKVEKMGVEVPPEILSEVAFVRL